MQLEDTQREGKYTHTFIFTYDVVCLLGATLTKYRANNNNNNNKTIDRSNSERKQPSKQQKNTHALTLSRTKQRNIARL